jgi:hypothetical protein
MLREEVIQCPNGLWAKSKKGQHRLEEGGEPNTKEEILEYFEICREQVEVQVPLLSLESPSGFDWLPFNKLELQLYNIRHTQHHAGELSERLGATGDIEVQWIGTQPES